MHSICMESQFSIHMAICKLFLFVITHISHYRLHVQSVFVTKIINLTRTTQHSFTTNSILFSSINCLHNTLYVLMQLLTNFLPQDPVQSGKHTSNLLLQYPFYITFNFCCIFQAASVFRFLNLRPECISCGHCFFLISYSFI